MEKAGNHRIKISFFKNARARRCIISLACIVVLLALIPNIAGIVMPEQIHVSRHEVFLEGLPRALDGIKIVQISDTHRCLTVKDDLIKAAVTTANRENADIAVLTGDYVSDNAGNAEPCARILSKLQTRRGTYAVLGNHDYWTDSGVVTNSLKEQGIRVLVNSNEKIAPRLYIVGLDDYWAGEPNLEQALAGIPKDAAVIILSHNPLMVKAVSDKPYFMLSGHTHGLQAHIPFISDKWMPGLNRSRFVKGMYREGKSAIYVNQGLGMATPSLKFIHRPEVTILQLRSKIDERLQ